MGLSAIDEHLARHESGTGPGSGRTPGETAFCANPSFCQKQPLMPHAANGSNEPIVEVAN